MSDGGFAFSYWPCPCGLQRPVEKSPPSHLNVQEPRPLEQPAQPTAAASDEFAGRRRQVVEELRREGIRSQAVLDAIDRVPRHKFVPAELLGLAYYNRRCRLAMSRRFHNPSSSPT